MRRAKIQGRTTYYRVMKDLVRWGYVEYWPGDGRRESEVGIGATPKKHLIPSNTATFPQLQNIGPF
jgi:hypothetical protein